LREGSLHGLPVLKDVADTGGRPAVVLEHHPGTIAAADEVGSADVDVDVLGDLDLNELATEVAGRKDVVRGDDAVLDDALVVVEVVEEEVEGGDALDQAALQIFPLLGADDPWDEVEGEDPLGALGIAIDVEGHALTHEGEVDFGPALVELVRADLLEEVSEALVVATHLRGSCEHLVEKPVRIVPLQHRIGLRLRRGANKRGFPGRFKIGSLEQ
jgi:hypothetical protein